MNGEFSLTRNKGPELLKSSDAVCTPRDSEPKHTPLTYCNSDIGVLVSKGVITLELVKDRNAVCIPGNTELEDAAIPQGHSQRGFLGLQRHPHGRILQCHAAGCRPRNLPILAVYRHNPANVQGVILLHCCVPSGGHTHGPAKCTITISGPCVWFMSAQR